MNAQDLKNSILQRAIEGKLVPQQAEEGTARDLLVEIRAEKEKLIRENQEDQAFAGDKRRRKAL
jgi:type I restriction enzyme S subunit